VGRVRRKLYERLARPPLGWESVSAVVNWAVGALTARWDAVSLAALAGLQKSPNEFEVDQHLRAVRRYPYSETASPTGLLNRPAGMRPGTCACTCRP
jgi:hypothetical protein